MEGESASGGLNLVEEREMAYSQSHLFAEDEWFLIVLLMLGYDGAGRQRSARIVYVWNQIYG